MVYLRFEESYGFGSRQEVKEEEKEEETPLLPMPQQGVMQYARTSEHGGEELFPLENGSKKERGTWVVRRPNGTVAW